MIVAGVLPSSNSMALGLVAALAWAMAQRSVPVVLTSSTALLVTWEVESSARSSSASSVGCNRHRRRSGRPLPARLPADRSPVCTHGFVAPLVLKNVW